MRPKVSRVNLNPQWAEIYHCCMGTTQKTSVDSPVAAKLGTMLWCKVLLMAILAIPWLAYAQEKDSGSHPQYRVYRNRAGEGIVSVVISVSTTDQQLKNLLWFFRKNIRTGNFKAVGIAKPPDKRFGHLGYTAGMISVYRGEKCANEQFSNSLGPCGYGEHDAAFYQWGVDGDPGKDSGDIRAKNGEMSPVFDHTDGWKPR
jgi:hypothetical protein